MQSLLPLIPASVTSLIGVAVVLAVLIIGGTFLQEWGKSLYTRKVLSGKNKRAGSNPNFDGIDCRDNSKHLDAAMAELVHSLTLNNQEFRDFIKAWKESHAQMKDDIDEIKRNENRNWKRLFDEELPNISRG